MSIKLTIGDTVLVYWSDYIKYYPGTIKSKNIGDLDIICDGAGNGYFNSSNEKM